jgi:pimeloyl-ACP methyl ester carboxylesterase
LSKHLRRHSQWIAREAAAYAKTGLLAAVSKNRRSEGKSHGEFGVLFVHGVAANATQFHSLRRSLEPELRSFDDFEYGLRVSIPELALRLERHIESLAARYTRTLLIGHSLGGLLSAMVLQRERPLPGIAGMVSICAPLHGTHRSKLAPKTSLSLLAPDGPLIGEMLRTRDRLEPYRGRILTITAKRDAFVVPSDSSRLDTHEHLEFEHVGHVATLFDDEVQAAVKRFVLKARDKG